VTLVLVGRMLYESARAIAAVARVLDRGFKEEK
jgi:hypothetical protein